MKAGLGRLHDLCESGLTGGQLQLNSVDQGVIDVPAHGRSRSRVADDHSACIGSLSRCDGARRIEAVHQHLRSDGHVDGDRVYPHSLGLEQSRFGGGVTEVGPTVADQHDVSTRVTGHDRPGELESRGDIGVMRVGLTLERAELGIGGCIELDLRIAREAHQTSAVVALARGE